MESSLQPNDVSAHTAVAPTLPDLSTGNQSLAEMMSIPNPVITPPVSPSGAPQNIDIESQQQGTFQSGPNPGAKAINQPEGNLDYIRSLGDAIQDDSLVKDKFKYGRQYAYGSDYKNLNFERYYTHSKFKELGFSPFRDNEAVYNEKGSVWDDFNRARGQWLGIAWNAGFKGVWGDSIEANEAMNKGMAIGSSSKEGLGAWTTNLFLNSAFTGGIMAEMLVEDIALTGADILTAGVGTPEALALASARGGLAVGRLKKVYNTTSEFISALKDADKAKNFFTAARAGELGKSAMQFLNPLEHTTAFADQILHGTNGLRDLQKKTKIVTGFGEFYKDLRQINLAHAEAKMEGQSGADLRQQKLIDEYYNDHGQMPEGDAAEKINEESKAVKGNITLANDMFIYYSNKLVFENLFDGIVPGGKAAKAALTGTGKVLETTAAKDLAAEADAFKIGKESYIKKIPNFLFKSEYSPISKAYILGNLAEGIQEVGQDIIQSTAKNYYDKLDKDPTQIGMANTLSSLGVGIGQEMNEQGISTFMSGYLMGALIQPVSGGMMRVLDSTKTKANNLANAYKAKKDGTTPIVEKSNFQKEKEEKEKTDNEIVNAANHIRRNILTYGDTHQVLAAKLKLAQEAKNKAIETGDRVAFENMQDQISMDKFHVLAKTKNMGALTEHVNDILTLSDEDLEKAWLGKTKAADIREKLNTFKERAESYQARYDYAQEKMANPFNPWKFDAEKQPELFKRELSRYRAHDTAIENLLFATEDYDLVAKKMSKITNNLSGIGALKDLVSYVGPGAEASRAKAQDVSLLIDHSQRALIMESLPDQISLLNTGNAKQKKQASELQQQYDILKEWEDITGHYKNELKSDQKSQADPAELEKRKQERKYLPGAVLKSKTNNKKYTIKEVKNGKIKVVDEEGKEKTLNKRNTKGGLNHEIVKESSQSALNFADSGDSLTDAIFDMHTVFDKYIRHIGKINNGHVFTNKIQEAFHDVKDFYHWENQADVMVRTVNMLSDPDYFNRYTDILTTVHEVRLKNLEPFKEALGTYWNNVFCQGMINALYDYKVVPNIDDVEAIKTFTITKFNDAQTGKVIPEGSDLYNQSLIIVASYKIISEKKEEEDRKKAEAAKAAEEAAKKKTNEPIKPEVEEKTPQKKEIQTFTVGDKSQINYAIIEKDGVNTYVIFEFKRSDKPGVVSDGGGYYYGEKYGNTIDDFFNDYGITKSDLDNEDFIIKAIKVLEEKHENGETSLKVQLSYEDGKAEIKEISVNKQKFTTAEFTNLSTAQKTNITTNDLKEKTIEEIISYMHPINDKMDIHDIAGGLMGLLQTQGSDKHLQLQLFGNNAPHDGIYTYNNVLTAIMSKLSEKQSYELEKIIEGESQRGETLEETTNTWINQRKKENDLKNVRENVSDKDKIMSEINKVATGQELDEWMSKMRKLGILESEIVELAKQKQTEMINTLDWSDLEKNQIVIMKNNSTMVIKDIKGDKVFLMKETDYKAGIGEVIVLLKDDLKSKNGIELISKFASSLTTTEDPLESEVKESDKIVDAAKEIGDPAKNASSVQEGLESTEEDPLKSADELAKKC